MSAQRRSLTKAQLATAIGAELCQLLVNITSDGVVEVAEVDELASWLESNRNVGLPAIDALLPILEDVRKDGRVTDSEIKVIQREIEACLPKDLRTLAALSRRRVSDDERAHAQTERAAAKAATVAERARRSVERERYAHESFDFMVAGVRHDGRERVVRGLVEEQSVCFRRDPGNPFDRNAIEVRDASGAMLGYVPCDEAREMAPWLDAGAEVTAKVKKLLDGRQCPIPVIKALLRLPRESVPQSAVAAIQRGGGDTSNLGCIAAAPKLFALVLLASAMLVGLYACVG